ncbi:polysaccharide deacetylase family protein [Dolosicoccus paucivorans]
MKQLIKGFILILLLVYTSPYKAQANELSQPGLMLTFDDHSIDDWLAVQSLFDQYGAKATYYVNLLDQLTDEELTSIQRLHQLGNEIGSHGFLHLSAPDYLKEHTVEEYIQSEIVPSLQALKALGIQATSFAYPYGARNKDTDLILLKHFKTLRGTAYLKPDQSSDQLSSIYYSFNQPREVVYGLGLDESYGYTDEEILQALQHAVDTGQVVVFYGHRMDPTNQLEGEYTHWHRLEKILQFAKENQMTYYTASDLLLQ